MTQRRSLIGTLVVILALVVHGHAQETTSQRASGTIGETVTAVVVDVVVRDRRGQPVRDLTQADFQVLEDGVPQTIGSFSAVFAERHEQLPRPRAAPGSAATDLKCRRQPIARRNNVPVTALVFDRLSPEARRLAVQASQKYLGTRKKRRATSASSASTWR